MNSKEEYSSHLNAVICKYTHSLRAPLRHNPSVKKQVKMVQKCSWHHHHTGPEKADHRGLGIASANKCTFPAILSVLTPLLIKVSHGPVHMGSCFCEH